MHLKEISCHEQAVSPAYIGLPKGFYKEAHSKRQYFLKRSPEVIKEKHIH